MSLWLAAKHIRLGSSCMLPCRLASSAPVPSKIQLKKPAGERGHFSYGRNVSRDPSIASKYKSQQGDTPTTFMLRRLGHAYEVYPFICLSIVIIAGIICNAYYSFTKIEVWFYKTAGMKAPWDWERCRDNYWKYGTVFFDLDNRLRKRCETMEILQDQMLEAAKKRGTR